MSKLYVAMSEQKDGYGGYTSAPILITNNKQEAEETKCRVFELKLGKTYEHKVWYDSADTIEEIKGGE